MARARETRAREAKARETRVKEARGEHGRGMASRQGDATGGNRSSEALKSRTGSRRTEEELSGG